jgi:hypothetical protein
VPFPFAFARLNALQAAVRHSHRVVDGDNYDDYDDGDDDDDKGRGHGNDNDGNDGRRR